MVSNNKKKLNKEYGCIAQFRRNESETMFS